jgi:uncharacterized membrane protein
MNDVDTNQILLPEDSGIKPEQLARKLHSAEVKVAESISNFAGSMGFVYVHILWFTFWILANYGLLNPIIPIFDPFPYGLLTMVVSLEAIFLSTFILITQNRQALVDTYRELEDEQEQKQEEKDQDELEKDVEDISEDVEDIGQDVEELGQDVEGIQKDLDEIKQAMQFIQDKIMTVEKKKDKPNK